MESYVVAGSRPWNKRLFNETIRHYPGQWTFVATPEELTAALADARRQTFVFFLHWSWIVPSAIVSTHVCVCFHMTDLPYGRGGSPLQNLIERGVRTTKLTALRMDEGLDTGPIYLKRDLCLEGSAEEIYIRAGRLAASMIQHIIEERPEPVPQRGHTEVFSRRRPEQSVIPDDRDLIGLYDFIRMLDAEGYPRAFLEHGGLRFELQSAVLYDGRVECRAVITPKETAS